MGNKAKNSRTRNPSNRTKVRKTKSSGHSTKSKKQDGCRSISGEMEPLVFADEGLKVEETPETADLEAIEARITMLREDSRMAGYRIAYHAGRRSRIQSEIRQLKQIASNLQ